MGQEREDYAEHEPRPARPWTRGQLAVAAYLAVLVFALLSALAVVVGVLILKARE